MGTAATKCRGTIFDLAFARTGSLAIGLSLRRAMNCDLRQQLHRLYSRTGKLHAAKGQ